MTLGERQRAFMHMVPRLIDKAHALGFEISGGDLHRDPQCPYGSVTSKHHSKEAIDLNLFKRINGKMTYLRATEDHKELGKWWKKQGGIWGGDFTNKDGNHYQGSKTGLYTPDDDGTETCEEVEKEHTITIKISSNSPFNIEAHDK